MTTSSRELLGLAAIAERLDNKLDSVTRNVADHEKAIYETIERVERLERRGNPDYRPGITETRDPWQFGHNHPTKGADYFHNYGDCGGNLVDGCGMKKAKP